MLAKIAGQLSRGSRFKSTQKARFFQRRVSSGFDSDLAVCDRPNSLVVCQSPVCDRKKILKLRTFLRKLGDANCDPGCQLNSVAHHELVSIQFVLDPRLEASASGMFARLRETVVRLPYTAGNDRKPA